MRPIFALLLALAVLVLPTRAAAVKVLVNCWDGSAFVVVQRAYLEGALPNLKSQGPLGQMTSILPCGKDASGVMRCMAGVTQDQHATLLTGKDATIHGVWSNGLFDLIPNGLTVYEILREKVPGIKLAHFSGKCTYVGPQTFGNIIEDVDVFDACANGYQGNISPDITTARASSLIQEWEAAGVENWFVFVHFGQPDSAGHASGVNSQRYLDQLTLNDKRLGSLLKVVPPTAEVFVLSDHGFGTFEYPVWTPTLLKHNSHSPSTFYVRRGADEPASKYMDQLMPIWLELFDPEM